MKQGDDDDSTDGEGVTGVEPQVMHEGLGAMELGFTRPRITHLLDLTLLAPDLQERMLFVDAVDGVEPMSERALRAVAHAGSWKEQRKALEAQATSTARASST